MKADALLGPSALTWGVYDGYDNATAGFDYGDKDFVDIILPESALTGASITVRTVEDCLPTAITLSSFEASPGNRSVTLTWETATEIDTSGFNLYRAKSENGKYKKVNASLILAKGSDTQGASYEYTDTNVKNRKTYFYKLEDIDRNGKPTMHGPVSATPRVIYGIVK